MGTSRSGAIRANRVYVEARTIRAATIGWENGSIVAVDETGPEDPSLNYLLPGFVDAHVHIESSMLVPSEFGRVAARHGTVATVSDPHEIANVLGVDGVRYMLENAAASVFKVFFGAPSCVPATDFETAGATLGCDEIAALLDRPDVLYLSEMMNFPAVLDRNPTVLAKLALARDRGLPVDGHAPGLTGEAARRYTEAGISTDHECTTLEEAESKLAAGMRILIREGSAARDFDALHSLISSQPRRVMFCSDDKHPDDLQDGHIDRLAVRAVDLGHDVFDVLRCACLNAVEHYGLPVGSLRPGDPMDAVEVRDLHAFGVQRTWIDGRLAAENGQSLLPRVETRPINIFHAQDIEPADLEVPDPGGPIRVIGVEDGSLLTRALVMEPPVDDGRVVPDPARDILFLCVLNRYRPAAPAVAFVHGFGLQHGALASSVAHDSHNIVAVGADAGSLIAAVRAVVEHRGGIAVADGSRVKTLPLPVAGLMSTDPGDVVARRYTELDESARALGSSLRAPLMALSFMALLVIPELKLSDRGLFDGLRFAFTDLAL